MDRSSRSIPAFASLRGDARFGVADDEVSAARGEGELTWKACRTRSVGGVGTGAGRGAAGGGGGPHGARLGAAARGVAGAGDGGAAARGRRARRPRHRRGDVARAATRRRRRAGRGCERRGGAGDARSGRRAPSPTAAPVLVVGCAGADEATIRAVGISRLRAAAARGRRRRRALRVDRSVGARARRAWGAAAAPPSVRRCSPPPWRSRRWPAWSPGAPTG